MTKKKKDVVIEYSDGSKQVIPKTAWDAEIERQKKLKDEFDKAMIGVNVDSLDEVMDALMKKFLK